MLILVTSASGINGNGYGALLAFKRALMLRSPCAQWLEADDMRAPTQRNPPQYSPECLCTQYAIVAHFCASSQLQHQTIISNALISISHDQRSVHYLWNIDISSRAHASKPARISFT